ncbi:MAG: sigma 54-interacting transcriptional regulator [Desulfuromonadales bacterium]|nr:sigma 54-interacting transcriptional regulator [Desulfuromonadales bacterium]
MALIGLIHPDPIIAERARTVAVSLGLNHSLTIETVIVENSGAVARELELAGVDVIITRGMIVDIVKKAVETPIVEIPVTGQDLAAALHEAKQYTALERPQIALMAFSSTIKSDVEIFADLLNIDLFTYRVSNDRNLIINQLLRAKEDGAHVVVAGHFSANLARELGMHPLMLTSGDVALRTALLEAQTVAYARRLEKARTRRLQSIVDISKNGILVVDAAGNLQAVNTAARQVLNLDMGLEKRKARDILPSSIISLCLDSDEPIKDEILKLNNIPYLCSTDMIKMESSVTDVILTLQPAAAIGELESKLRKSLHARGLTAQYSFKDILGVSDVIMSTIALARAYATTDNSVLLLGETGTGKELFAQAIHQAGPNSVGPFVAINCAALPPSLLESELFGHEEGAFTGARRKGKPGLFELAHNGTIFLDEVSEMDHYGQTRLLRVLQERCTMRIGGDRYIPVNARVIAASNRNLAESVENGSFRRDLYYRLNTLPLKIPPLRARPQDVRFLASEFAERSRKKYAGALNLTTSIMGVLESHDWPGNVRELLGFMERLTLVAQNVTLTEIEVKNMLLPETDDADVRAKQILPASKKSYDSEHDRITSALLQNNGHQGLTSQQLGMHRSTLLRKMKKMGIRFHRTLLE